MEFSFDLSFIAPACAPLLDAGYDNIALVTATCVSPPLYSSPPLPSPLPSAKQTGIFSTATTPAHVHKGAFGSGPTTSGAISPGSKSRAHCGEVLDVLGRASASMQTLSSPITSADKLRANPDQHVYIAYEGNVALGFIKVGKKTLFITRSGGFVEINALCVLDFAVLRREQRKGVGRRLFDAMCFNEGVTNPATLAYDRPSHMFLSFLARHFGLRDFTPQPNNFVVFEDYFTGKKALPSSGSTKDAGRVPPAMSAGGWSTRAIEVGTKPDASLKSPSRGSRAPASASAPFATSDNVTASSDGTPAGRRMVSPAGVCRGTSDIFGLTNSGTGMPVSGPRDSLASTALPSSTGILAQSQVKVIPSGRCDDESAVSTGWQPGGVGSGSSGSRLGFHSSEPLKPYGAYTGTSARRY